MKKNLIKYVGFALAIILIVWFILYNRGTFDDQQQAVPVGQNRAQALSVKAHVMREATLTDQLVAAGSVIPDEEVDISAEASGRVVTIHFQEGIHVEKGELLVTINNADLLAQAERNGYQVSQAEERERRQHALLNKQGISQQTYDQYMTELATLKAEAALLKAQLDKTMIRAPFSGVLGLRHISEGSYVSPGVKIVRLARTQPVKIEFGVPERYSSYLQKGGEVRFTVENQAGEFVASIYAVEPVIDTKSRSLPVRAIFNNTSNKIMPGSFARVLIDLRSVEDALQVPTQAVIPELGANKVFVYRKGFAEQAYIELGLRTPSKVQVVSGLKANDTVLMTGILQLRQGMKVSISEIVEP